MLRDPLLTFLLGTAETGLTEEQHHDPFWLMGITVLFVVFKTMGLLSLLCEHLSVTPVLFFEYPNK